MRSNKAAQTKLNYPPCRTYYLVLPDLLPRALILWWHKLQWRASAEHQEHNSSVREDLMYCLPEVAFGLFTEAFFFLFLTKCNTI